MTNEAQVDKNEESKGSDKKDQKPSKDKMIKVRESEHAQLAEDAAKYKDQYIRLYAEFENARKRMDREKQEFVRYANEGLIVDFLNILDDLQRSIDSAKTKHQDYEAFIKGVEMVMAQISAMLKRNNVKAVESEGKMFDPHCHEVLMQEERDDMDDGAIIEEFQKGYCLGDKVVRTAKVKVAKKKSEEGSTSQ